MSEKYIITKLNNSIVSGIYADNNFSEINVIKEESSRLNNIYVGRVETVVKNINCAFIEIEKGVKCYYPLDSNTSPVFLNSKKNNNVCQNDLLLVQVCTEALKTKPPTVTSNINLAGKYVALTMDATSVLVSSKIKDKKRVEQLKDLLSPLLKADDASQKINETTLVCDREFGFIVRTNAEKADDEIIKKEALKLVSLYSEIMKIAPYRTAFTKLYVSEPDYIKDINGIRTERLESIITDDNEIYKALESHLQENSPDDLKKLVFYNDKLLPLYKLYSIESTLREALKKQVWLKSGGYLVIEPTEALTVIDVNTGKFSIGKKPKEESFLKINLEAVTEISKQIKLRNISGIIIVDFINMKSNENNEILLQTLSKLFKQDSIPTTCVGMTKLGLVEITRKKTKKPLHEMCIGLQL